MNFRNQPRTHLPLFQRLTKSQPGEVLRVNISSKEFGLIVRDRLERLLNTRCILEVIPDEYKHIQNSVLQYGIPDILSKTEEEICRFIEQTILKFEPALLAPQVNVARNLTNKNNDGKMYLEICAQLKVDPEPEPIVFKTAYNHLDGVIQIR